jgi:hypothetical protein
MSQIQLGIQTAHCVTAMYAKSFNHGHESSTFQLMHEYASDHMTKIILQGGNCDTLQQIHARIKAILDSFWKYESQKQHIPEGTHPEAVWYPFAKFHEDEQSLNGALTCVGIVLPEEIYNFASNIREGTFKVSQNENEIDSDRISYTVLTTSDPRSRVKYDKQVNALEELGLLDSEIALAEMIAYARLA